MMNSNFAPTINSIWMAQSHLLEYTQRFLNNYSEKQENSSELEQHVIFPKELILDKKGNIFFLCSNLKQENSQIKIICFSSDLRTDSSFSIPVKNSPKISDLNLTNLKHSPSTKMCFTYNYPSLVKIDLQNFFVNTKLYSAKPGKPWVSQIYAVIKKEAICKFGNNNIYKFDSKGRFKPLLDNKNYIPSCFYIGKNLINFGTLQKTFVMDKRNKKIIIKRQMSQNQKTMNLLNHGFWSNFEVSKDGFGLVVLKKILNRNGQKECEIKVPKSYHGGKIHTYYKEKENIYPKEIFFSFFVDFENEPSHFLTYKISTEEMKTKAEYKIFNNIIKNIFVYYGCSFLFKKMKNGSTLITIYETNKHVLEQIELEKCAVTFRRQISEKKSVLYVKFKPELDFLILQEQTGFIKIFSIKNCDLYHLIKFSDLLDPKESNEPNLHSKIIRILNKEHFLVVTAGNKKIFKYTTEQSYLCKKWISKKIIVNLYIISSKNREIIIVVYDNSVITLLDFELKKIADIDTKSKNNTVNSKMLNFFYIEDLDKLAISSISENPDTGNSSCSLGIYSGKNFKKKEIERIFKCFNQTKFFYAKENKILFLDMITYDKVLTGVDLKTNKEFKLATDTEATFNLKLLHEKGPILKIGMTYTSKIFEADLEKKEWRRLEVKDIEIKIDSLYLPQKGIMISYDTKKNILSNYDMKSNFKENDMQVENVSRYNYEREEKLKSWIKKWSCFIHIKDEVTREIKFVNCVAYFNRADILKLTLDIFGYPICTEDRVIFDDPYYTLYDRCEVNDEVKELLKEYLIREGRDAIYSEEQRKRLNLNE